MVRCKIRMDLHQLRCFLTLADELHFGRTADRLGLTQPSLSRLIQQLEASVGAELFDRSGKAVRLTRAGEAFRDDAQRYVDGMVDAIGKARRISSGHTDRLRVAFPSNFSTVIVPRIVEHLRIHAPEIALTLREMATAAHESALRNGEVDVVLTTLPVHDLGLTQRFLFSEPLVLMLGEKHPLARQKKISLKHLADETFLVCPTYRTTGFHEMVLERYAAFGFSPRMGPETDSKVLLAELVANGAGIAAVTESAAQLDWPGVAYRSFVEKLEPLRVAAAWLTGNEEPARKAFVAAAVECTRTLFEPKQALAS